MQGDERLIREVQALAPDGDRIEGAFIGLQGPRPGSEVLVLLPYPLLLMLTDNHVLAVGVCVAVFVAIQILRSYATVVRTDRQVLLAPTGRRRHIRLPVSVERHTSDAIRPDPAGRNKVTVGEHTYWVSGVQHEEAIRLAKLPARPG